MSSILKDRKKIFIICAVIIIIAIISTLIAKHVENLSSRLDPEILRSMSYKQITDEDSKVGNTDFVKFSAFFTRDLDGDGNAEKLLGTCRNVNSTDQLYIDLNVLTNGYLKDGVITINGTNFTYSMSMVKDSVLKNNYISDDVKTIELNQINAGTQKLIIGDVLAYIGNNINNYSNISSITLTGTHVSDEGVETPISKTVDLTIDWYGTTKAYFRSSTVYYNYDELETPTISFGFTLEEKQKELILKENEAAITIPELNGYAPTEVKCTNSNIESEYNNDTKVLTIKRASKCDDTGSITSTLSRSNTYTVTITYPQEAYDAISSYTTLTIPMIGYYTGYNNVNEEFTNPYKSNIVNGKVTIVFREKPKGSIYNFDVNFVDKRYVSTPSSRYVISKQDILNLYDNYDEDNEDEIQDKEYVVRWLAIRGTEGEVPSMIMSETKQEGISSETELAYGDKWDSIIMEEYVKNTGIYFENADQMLEENGTISVYNNDTNELIHTFAKAEWNNYTRQNPYEYESPVKHIRVETSKTNVSSTLSVYNVKELETSKILRDFTKEEVKDINLIYTYLTGVCNIEGQTSGTIKDMDYVYYVSEKSNCKISVQTKKIPTQEILNNQKIYIDALHSQEGDAKWQNGEFLVELPKEIVNMEINDISISNNSVQLVAYDLYQNDGKYFIKIITENEEPTSYRIIINCNMTPDPRAATENKQLKLYGYNKYCNEYYYETQDTYDVNSNNNTEEKVGNSTTTINLLSPTSLITLETITDYDETQENEITIAPNIAEVEKETRQATINVSLTNNYPNTVSGVQILGKVPFEGNTYILNGKDLGSKFTTTMTNEGVIIPEELQEKAIVYYSEKENPNKNIEDTTNGWILKENVQDFSKIKTYLIDLTQYTIQVGKSYTFDYVVNIPEGISSNLVSYSDHAVYYELNTEGGKLQLSTEPNKVGLRIVRKFELDLSKHKKGFETLKVPGAVYTMETVNTEGDPRTRILTTDSDGNVNIKDLYVGLTYTVKELKSPGNYSINNEIIEFKVLEDEQGNLQLETNSEKVVLDKQNEKVQINTEDEPKYNITITKTDIKTKEPLSNITFKFNGKKYVTNRNGQITIEKLEQNTEYTLTETKADGYYILGDITFKLIKNEEGNLQIESNNEHFKEVTIQNTNEKDLIQVNVNLENEKIPTYDVQILKVAEDYKQEDINQLKPLPGARFILEYQDINKQFEYNTDENGNINIPNLYQYVEGKNITGTYILQELQAPEGYSNNAEEIQFKVVKNEEDKLEIKIENEGSLTTVKDIQIEENTVKIIIQDKPLFKLVKTDSETGEPLANAQFVIKELDKEGREVDYAKDVNGNYVGEKNEYDEYVITTDETGTIILPLRGGTYKIIEIGYPEGYQENANEQYFEIAGGKEEEEPDKQPDEQQVLEINTIEDLVELSKNVNAGNNYSGTTIKLMRSIDFNDSNSYRSQESFEQLKPQLTEGTGFTPIGKDTKNVFSGIFDGQGNEIRNLYINRYNYSQLFAGLFGYVRFGEINNIGVTGEIYCISNTNCWVGGIAGYTEESSINNCYNTSNINFQYSGLAGGITGVIDGSSINNCYNIGKVSGSESNNRISIAGGIAGILGIGSDKSSINNSYNIGEVSVARGDSEVGVIAGSITEGDNHLKNSYYLEDINIMGEVINQNGIMKSKDYMKSEAFVKDLGESYWSMDKESKNDGYPIIENEYDEHIENINYIEDLMELAKSVNEGNSYSSKTVRLMRNLDFDDSNSYKSQEAFEQLKLQLAEGTGFTPIGIDKWNVFSGIFDGQGNEIRNLYINSSSSNQYAGLFGYVRNAEIKNIGITGEINGKNGSIGGIAGYIVGGSISNCYNIGDIIGGEFVGGIAGHVNGGSISSCYNIGDIIGSEFAGGIVGRLERGRIGNCYNTGDIINNSRYGYAGGIAGRLDGSRDNTVDNYCYISNCYNIGNITSSKYTRGIFGNKFGNLCYINNCYCVESINTSEMTVSSDYMKSREFYNKLNFDNVWLFRSNSYPKLNMGLPAKIDEVTNLDIKNTLKEFNITTEIAINSENERIGGTITGEYTQKYLKENNIKFIETVIYNNNSTQRIEIKPEGEYYIDQILINNKKIEFTTDESGSVLLPEEYFKNVKEDKHIVVKFEKNRKPILIKLDEETNEPIANTEFAIYNISDTYEIIDFAKDMKGNYIGKQNEDGIYTIPTDENGQIELSLPDGLYKVVEVKAAEGYVLEESESLRTTYVKIGEIKDTSQEEANNSHIIINSIEDLIRLSNDVNSGNSYKGKTIVLARTLDFNEDASYDDPTDTSFGDYNGDETIEGIKSELTNEKGCGFKPIGLDYFSHYFSGTFNGQGYEIRNLYINMQKDSYVGLFGHVKDGKIKNLGVSGSINNINGTYTGGIVGDLNNSNIINSYNKIKINNNSNTSSSTNVTGGIAGSISNSSIINSYNAEDIICVSSAGGIAGSIYNSNIINCYNTGSISSSNSNAGGMAGAAYSGSYISNNYNIGEINGINGYAGGIAGNIYNGNIENCYYPNSVNITGKYISERGEKLPELYMKSEEFIKLLNSNKDHINSDIMLLDWLYNSDSYPTLAPIEIKEEKEIIITNKKLKQDNNLIINKIDKDTKQKLAGVKFKIESITGNGNLIGSMKSSSQYKFIKNGLQYVSNNNGVSNSVANAYFPIDLSNYEGIYKLSVNYDIYSQSNNDLGYATITTNTNIPEYNQNSNNINTNYRFIYASGSASNQTATVNLTGGQKYYLHIGYRKDGSTDTSSDRFYINSINLTYNTELTTNEEGIISTKIPTGRYKITEISALSGYALCDEKIVSIENSTQTAELVIENEKIPMVKDNSNFILTKKDKTTKEIIPGVKFMILDEQRNYAKDSNGSRIGIKENINGEEKYVVTTDEKGQIRLKLNVGKYKLVEVQTLEGYVLEGEQEFEITDENINYELYWEGKIINTNYPSKDYIRVTSDGGMIEATFGANTTIAAEDTANGKEIRVTSDKAAVVKYNNKGKVDKLVQFTGLTGTTAIYEDSEGDYIVVGEGKSLEIAVDQTTSGNSINLEYSGTSNRTIILKLNNELKVIWASKIDNFVPSITNNTYIGEDTNGEYILGIYPSGTPTAIPAEDTVDNEEIDLSYSVSGPNSILMEYTNDGKVKKAKKIPSGAPYSIKSKENGGYMIIDPYGYSGVIELDSEMNITKQFNNSLTGINLSYNNMYVTNDEGFIAGGTLTSNSVTINGNLTANGEEIQLVSETAPDAVLIKYNKDFKIEWIRLNSFVGQGISESNNYVKQDAQGNYISMVSISTSPYQYKIVKYDESGSIFNVIDLDYININSYMYVNNDINQVILNVYSDNKFVSYKLDNEDITPLNLEVTNQKEGKVIVHHYLEGTGPEYGNDPITFEEAPDETLVGKLGEEYTSAPHTDIPGHTLVKDEAGEYKIPENASGNYTEEVQHVYYYYNKNKVNLTVHHYLEGTENKVPLGQNEQGEDRFAEDEHSEYDEGDHYKTTPSEEVLQKYELVEVVGDEEKDITQDEVVIYYYKIKKHEITTRVEIPEGRSEDEKGGQISGEGEKPYEKVDHEKSSTKDITITPDTGYRIKQIRLVSTNEEGNKTESIIYGVNATNNAEITYTQNENGTVTLTKFEKMTEDKEVIVVFELDEGKLIVHHYIENTIEKIYDDQITVKPVGTKVETSPVKVGNYVLVEEPKDRNAIITKETQEKTYYYQEQYKITTEVIKHSETYKDGTVNENKKGGQIESEDEDSHELVLKNRSNEEDIEIKPDTGYEVVSITIKDGKEAEEGIKLDFDQYKEKDENGKETGKVILPAGLFPRMQSDKHIQVEFRKKTNVIVKHLEAGTENVLYRAEQGKDYEELIGYEGQEYETNRKVIQNYMAAEIEVMESTSEGVHISKVGITNENKEHMTKYNKVQTDEKTYVNGEMYADTLTIIYWYTRVPSGIIVRHIETNEKAEEIEIEAKLLDGLAGLEQQTTRNEYDKYIPVDRKEENKGNTNENVTIISKDQNSKTLTFAENETLEAWYFYEKQYNVTTEVKPHEEKVLNEETKEYETVLKDGGIISKKYEKDEQGNDKLDDKGNKIETVYEKILSRGDSKEEIEIKPDDGYRIKTVIKQKKVIVDGKATYENEKVFIENMIKEDGSLILGQNNVSYLTDVQNDYNIVVEFERIPTKVIVQYKDAYTKETIHEDKEISGFVNDKYNESRIEIENYIPADPEPGNSKGTMTKETIIVTYWYTKQFVITTDVIEHTEKDDDGKTVSIKGGNILGEDNRPYEIVKRGENNTLVITMEPEDGYRIKEIKINNKPLDYENDEKVVKHDKTIELPPKYFTNMQENKHITVEYEKIPAKVVVRYLDEETNEQIEKDDTIDGYVNKEYLTNEKEIKDYNLVKEKYPENYKGTMTEEDIVVTYYYKKLRFNMKIEKEIQGIKLNGQEVGIDLQNNKFAKLEVEYKEIENTQIEVNYNIKVTNTEKVAGIAIVEEIIPEGFEFVKEESDEKWVSSSEFKDNENIIENSTNDRAYMLKTKELNSGESVEYKVTLRWNAENSNKGEKINTAKIIDAENEPGYGETTLEDNEDKAIVEIRVKKTVQDVIDDVKDGKTDEVIKDAVDDVKIITKDIITSVKTGDPIAISVIVILIAGVVIMITIIVRRKGTKEKDKSEERKSK